MKVTYQWLKQYVDFNWSPDELVERLTLLGLEVERVEKRSGEFEGIVVAQVLAADKHPNADKLSVCKVSDGKGERQIVCGATNFKVGDKVPLALPGATLPKLGAEPALTIKVGKLRGVESQGMMCSAKELGLADDAEGLMLLPTEAVVGRSFAEHLGRSGGDVIYDLEITPNRPDWSSVIGIARELSALGGHPLRLPEVAWSASQESSDSVKQMAQVEVKEPGLCPRYVGRVIRGVKVGRSPAWLSSVLEKVGLRSINNVVDVTNFVMLETGQPLHAFDYHLLEKQNGKATVVVRSAAAEESFTTLDEKNRSLKPGMLLISDPVKAIALAGIMGGRNTEIQPTTVDVFLESAYFKPQSIRATSKALELRTDSSYRFERGGDIGVCDYASRRATQLILETAGGTVLADSVEVYTQPHQNTQLTLRTERTSQLLGLQISLADQQQYLRSLGLEVQTDGTTLRCDIPSFRVDLKQEVDLIEEVGRLYGVDKLPSTTPRGGLGQHPFDATYDQLFQARTILVGLGLSEAQGQTLIDSATAEALGVPVVKLANPLSQDMNALRPSLLPGLLDSARHNATRRVSDVGLFEIGKVFAPSSQGTESVNETRSAALLCTGTRNPVSWSCKAEEFEIQDLKGILEEFLEQFGVRGLSFQRVEQPTAQFFVESATIVLGKQPLGQIGLVHPLISRKANLRGSVFAAEMNLDLLLARRNAARSYKPLPEFPSIRRDVALLVDDRITHDQIVQAIRQTKPANLENSELFDIFRGSSLPAGKKSVAFALTYRNPEKTLTDAEVNSVHEKVIIHLQQALQATIR